ncbi:VOC family protein [Halomarina salina]|uniref:VOC family protein n=1 Tax=Halomarina salina TaxID=1872699 RepID=A0ABD5RNF1_9EURY|nr:VOC family protein [Halomarina salina]
MTHAIIWFDVPAEDLDRAAEFYSTVFDTELQEASDTDEPYLMFAVEEGEVGGGLFEAGEMTFGGGDTVSFDPGETGPTVYLTVTDAMSDALDRVRSAGGEILVGAEDIEGESMVYAIVRDTEGNRIGLMGDH